MPDHPQPDTQLLSTAGNPFPPGLKPVVVNCHIPGVPIERSWPQPLEDPPPAPDFSRFVTTEHYRYETFVPHDDRPRFKLRLEPRRRGETDAEYEWYRRGIERHYRLRSIYLGLCQALCTALGNHRACRQRICRRTGRCSSRRDEDRVELGLAVFPPCIPIDIDIIETYRREISEAVRRLELERGAAGEDGQSATPVKRPSRKAKLPLA